MYDWIESTFNVSGGVTQVIAVFLALAVVLLLFSLFIFVLKRLMGANAPQSRSRQPRVAVMDNAVVDSRRRLILIRRDNVEHLLLVGGPTDVVVEQNIVRNTPVAASRAPALASSAHAGPGTVKVPMAPGPDLPARPEEAAKPADRAMPATASLPAPTGPRPVPPLGSAAKQTVAPNAATPRTPAVTAVETRPASAPIAAATASPSIDKPDAIRPSMRAADLLKAATQNGFNRSANAQKKEPEPEVPLSAATEETVTVAPEIKPVAAQTSEEMANDTFNFGPVLKSQAKPSNNRERVVRGGHTITPPASGPAAKAKTALLRPLEPVAAPVPEKAEAASEGPPPDQTVPEPKEDKPDTDLEQNTTVAAEVSAAQTDTVEVEAQTETADQENQAKPETGDQDNSTVTETEDAALPDQEDTPLALTAEPKEEAADVKAEPESSETPTLEPDENKLDLKLELGDLIDDAVLEPIAADAPADDAPPPETPKVEPPKTDDPSENGAVIEVKPPVQQQSQMAPEQGPKNAASLDIVPNRRSSGSPRILQGLGDKNPIEDEMAKLLDELGGQPNQ